MTAGTNGSNITPGVPAWATQTAPSLYPPAAAATHLLGTWSKAPQEVTYTWTRGSSASASASASSAGGGSSGGASNSNKATAGAADGNEGTHLSAAAYEACRGRQTNVLVGDSHMRFSWNWVAYRYHDGQKAYLNTLDGKHGAVAARPLHIPHATHLLGA